MSQVCKLVGGPRDGDAATVQPGQPAVEIPVHTAPSGMTAATCKVERYLRAVNAETEEIIYLHENLWRRLSE